MFVTVAPESLAASVLKASDRLIAVSDMSPAIVEIYCGARGLKVPSGHNIVAKGHVVSLTVGRPELIAYPIILSSGAKRRHLRKYAEGCLGEDKSFYFRGADERLKLRARNVISFLDLADGVDDQTWSFHRDCGDYSRWFADAIKDVDLAAEVARLEKADDNIEHSKAAIRLAVEKRYTLPAAK